MKICVLGAGAFGSALACSFAQSGVSVALWGRDPAAVAAMAETRRVARLPGVVLPETVVPVHDIPRDAEIVLLSVPMQSLAQVVRDQGPGLEGKALVACCKGLSLKTGLGPTGVLAGVTPHPAILTGPSFAADIAQGLPTALTLACRDLAHGAWLQDQLRAPHLRLYRSTDVIGAEMGGALKNVIAIGCGAVIGAGLGPSARAAVMTRGFAEMTRFAQALGAEAETLRGLSGLGDLTLTCTSEQSRNYRFGLALGQSLGFDPNVTVEGVATARALAERAARDGVDMPITHAIVGLLDGVQDVGQAVRDLLSRPMKEE